jgi:hypothetical protein
MAMQELVELRAIALRKPSGLRDVPFGHLEKMREIVELEPIAGDGEREEGSLVRA